MERVKILKGVKARAQQGKTLVGMGFKGGEALGIARATQLLAEDTIGLDDLRVIRNWYARHVITSRPSYIEWVNAGRPVSKEYKNKIRGAVAWLLWGGDEGLGWVNKHTDLLNRVYETDYKKILV